MLKLEMFIESEKRDWFCTCLNNRKTLSGVSGEWERGRNWSKTTVVPTGRAGKTKALCFGGAQWSSLTPPLFVELFGCKEG